MRRGWLGGVSQPISHQNGAQKQLTLTQTKSGKKFAKLYCTFHTGLKHFVAPGTLVRQQKSGITRKMRELVEITQIKMGTLKGGGVVGAQISTPRRKEETVIRD